MKIVVIVILLLSSQSAMASVLPGVLTALGDSASDTLIVAGLVLVIYVGITVMRYLRMAVSDGSGDSFDFGNPVRAGVDLEVDQATSDGLEGFFTDEFFSEGADEEEFDVDSATADQLEELFGDDLDREKFNSN